MTGLMPRKGDLPVPECSALSLTKLPIITRAMQGPCSVGQVLEHIRLSSREWSTHRLLQVADLKFTYEQEAAPEAFFTPYVWQLVLEHSGIKWQVGEQTCSQPPGSNIDRGEFEL